jgi:hypothetical protein
MALASSRNTALGCSKRKMFEGGESGDRISATGNTGISARLIHQRISDPMYPQWARCHFLCTLSHATISTVRSP